MSEYWKSTPKYWCKHCKTFVKDTKFEKTNHEATPKHQGNLKRFLRDLHRGHEREEREKERAKHEVDRLNGVVTGSPSTTGGAPWERKTAIPPSSSGPRQATPADRKKQLAQLAEMGVGVPEDFRKEMAMAGDWQITSQRLLCENVKKEEDNGDVKPAELNVGVRKRKLDGQEEEEEAGEMVVRKGWGSTIRTYPGTNDDAEDDLDALLNSRKTMKRVGAGLEDTKPGRSSSQTGRAADHSPDRPPIKQEDSADAAIISDMTADSNHTGNVPIKQEETASPGVVFKKRKAKPASQRG